MTSWPPKRFSDLKDDPFAQSLHEFVNEPESFVRMVTASELGRPAVEGLIQPLIKRFIRNEPEGKDRFDPLQEPNAYRYRQLVGKLVKDVMTKKRWSVKERHKKVRSTQDMIFKTGAVYFRDDSL